MPLGAESTLPFQKCAISIPRRPMALGKAAHEDRLQTARQGHQGILRATAAHICEGTALTPARSAPGLGSPL
jgi:hypothetical protein